MAAREIPGVLLAGGLARRMGGGDKPMRSIAGSTILERAGARLSPQCSCLILNANGDLARFARFGLPVVADGVAGFPGPLAGILAALDWIAVHRPDANWVLSAAADCPFLPRDLVARLDKARAVKQAAKRLHFVPISGIADPTEHAAIIAGIEQWLRREDPFDFGARHAGKILAAGPVRAPLRPSAARTRRC